MPRHRPGPLASALFALIGLATPLAGHGADEARRPALPSAAPGWSIRLLAEAPTVQYPTAAVAAPDGSIFVGQDPRDMPGPVNAPIDSVLLIRPDGTTHRFAEGLNSVMGLEWVDGTLIVVHAPLLSSFRDADGDGRAETRVDLVTGFGPPEPAGSGLNDHLPAGVRLGMDGFLYVAVGDKGIPRATGRDGRSITLPGGGVVRVRPDGTDLEVVSTGERNPLSVVLDPADEVFTFGNDDDAHLWPNSLTHHIVGGHYGYPFEFRHAPHRALPIVAGQVGGAGAQGMFLRDSVLPERYQGNLVFCDWGLQTVARYEVEPAGATHRLVRREAIVTRGDLSDFRPFSVVPLAEAGALLIVDWAFNGWLGDGPPTGRLFRLDYTGADRQPPQTWPIGATVAEQLAGLSATDRAVRLANQRLLARGGPAVVDALVADLNITKWPSGYRTHVLWALDAIGTPPARAAIRAQINRGEDEVQAQACRSAGIRRDALAEEPLRRALRDPRTGPVARREAAIALGRLPNASSSTRASLFEALGDADPTVAWSVRRAIRQTPADPADADRLAQALADPARRESALTLADGWYSPAVVRVLARVAQTPGDPAWRSRVVAALGGLYAKVPAWSGAWAGPNPAAGPRPSATEAWDAPSMALVLDALSRASRDADPAVRRQAILGAIGAGSSGLEVASSLLASGVETDPANLASLARFVGDQRDARAVAPLARLLADATQPDGVREAALDALGNLAGREALNARMALLYEAQSPPALVARALPPLGRARLLPSNDLIGFLDHASSTVRAAALGSFPVGRPLGRGVPEALLIHQDDPSPEVRLALIEATARHGIRAAVPWLVGLAEAEATDPATRTAATRALTGLPDPRGIPALVAALGDRDPELRRAAVAALTPLHAEAAPEITRRASRGDFQGAGALAAERLLAEFHFVAGWHVLGPLPAATGPIFADPRAIDLARPLAGPDGWPVPWRTVLPRSWNGTFDIRAPGPEHVAAPEGATAFALAEVESDREQVALLAVGASGPLIVVVDDKPLAHFGAAVANETIRVPLHQGTNRLLLRLRSAGEPWWAQVRISGPERAVHSPEDSVDGSHGVAVSPVREGLRAVALRTTGDPQHGAALFREVGCVRCHATGREAAAVPGLGPNLDGLASKYDRAEIVRSILEPSSRLAIGFVPVVVALRDGTSLTGLLQGEGPDGSPTIVGPEGTSRVVAARTIADRKAGRVSTMPEGLVDHLRPTEFVDLVTFLLTLKGPGSTATRPAAGTERVAPPAPGSASRNPQAGR